MREVLGVIFLGLLVLSSCVQGGNHPTYIISEKVNEQAPPYDEEEAR